MQQQIPLESPHNIEAEQCLLGAVLLNNGALSIVDPLVSAGDFFEPIHSDIFKICGALISDGKLASPITVKGHLPADLSIAGMPVARYLARLCAEAATIINAPDFAKVVRDLANCRKLIEVLADGSHMLRCAPVDAPPDSIAMDTIERIDEIITGHIPNQLRAVSIGEAADRALHTLSEAMAGRRGAKVIPWGLADLDRRTDGIHRAELSLVAGRPGMGKSGLAVHVAMSASEAEYRTLYWSGEMTAEALTQRALTALVYKLSGGRRRIAYSDLRTGRGLSSADFDLVRDARDRLRTLSLIVDEQPSLSLSQIAMRARRLKLKQDGLDLLIIDHLHKIRPAERYRGDATAETTEISNGCAALAKELDIGLVVLCQLNRGPEGRDDKRPMLSDLRQSGSLEQDADIVLFPYREAYYLLGREPPPGSTEHLTWQEKMAACNDRLEINIAKQRQGATGPMHCFTAIESNVFYSEAAADGGEPSVRDAA